MNTIELRLLSKLFLQMDVMLSDDSFSYQLREGNAVELSIYGIPLIGKLSKSVRINSHLTPWDFIQFILPVVTEMKAFREFVKANEDYLVTEHGYDLTFISGMDAYNAFKDLLSEVKSTGNN